MAIHIAHVTKWYVMYHREHSTLFLIFKKTKCNTDVVNVPFHYQFICGLRILLRSLYVAYYAILSVYY